MRGFHAIKRIVLCALSASIACASWSISMPVMRSSVERNARETRDMKIIVAINMHEILRPSGRSQIFTSVV